MGRVETVKGIFSPLKIFEDCSKEIRLVDILGKCVGVLGIRGTGKTNTAAVLVEELLKSNVPVTIVDIDGEYWGLKEKYEILLVGKGENSDIKVEMGHAEALAKISVEKGIPMVLDMSDFLASDMETFLLDFSKALWEISGKVRRPYFLVLEEAHEFIPQGPRTLLKEYLTRIALRGRKRGLGVILVSQRSARVEKDVLTQAEMLFLHKVVHPVDLRVYKELLPLDSAEVDDIVPKLDVGEAIFYYKGEATKVKIRKRYTFHAGYTPLEVSHRPLKLKSISKEILRIIEEAKKVSRRREDEIYRLRREVEVLRVKLAERDEVIKKLQDQVELLSKLRVKVEQASIPRPVLLATELNSTISGAVFEIQRILLRVLGKLPPSVLAAFKVLEENYPRWLTYQEIAEWAGYSVKTISGRNFRKLLRFGLIEKSRRLRNVVFRSNLKSFIEKRIKFSSFKSVDVDKVYDIVRNILLETNLH